MKVCGSCGKEGEDDYVVCPSCGAKYEETPAPADEDTVGVTEEPQAEEAEPVAAVEAEPEEAVAPESEAEENSVLAKTAFGKKAEKSEKKNHFIVNGVVALFSFLLFLLTFFAGAKILPAPTVNSGLRSLASAEEDLSEEEFEDLYGDLEGLDQSMTDILVGAFGLIETDRAEMTEYVTTAYANFFKAMEEAYKKYEKDIEALEEIKDEKKYEKEAEKLYRKMISYAVSKSDFNVVKVNYYMARLGFLQNSDRALAYAGSIVAVLMGVLLLVTLICSFVFFVLAAVSLAKRKQVRPFRALTTPLALYLMAFAICSINPIATANGVTVACIALSFAGAFLLCAAKRLILDKAESFTAKSLVRGVVSLLCAGFAFFLLCGTLFTVKLGKYTVHASMGLSVKELLRGTSAGGSETYAFGCQIDTASLIMLSVGLIAWLCAIAATVRCVLAAYGDLYTGKDVYETNRGKRATSIGFPIAAAVFAVTALVLFFVTFGECSPSVSVGVVFAFALLAVGATVKGILSEAIKVQEQF